MARRSRGNVVSSLYDLMKTLFRGPKDAASKKHRGFGFETLEGRAMLATDFGAITGLVYRDANNNGFTAGEQIVGATVNLYTDDGDGIFEPGAGDPLANSTTTNASGQYRFDDLVAGSYRQGRHQIGRVPPEPGRWRPIGKTGGLAGLQATGLLRSGHAILYEAP